MEEYVLQMNNIEKSFSSTKVLKGVTFRVKPGEVHAVCGENGAGKSTMMKILSGFYPYGEYSGDIVIEGQVRKFMNTRESTAAGVEIIYQELEVANNMTVAENIYLGHEPTTKFGVVDKEQMIHGAARILNRLKVDIDPNIRVEELGVGKKQMVVIAKSLLKQPKVLILDEPSAALTEAETENLLDIIRDLRQSGVACVYISHRLDEVMEISDTITVIRDGESIITDKRVNMDKEKLIQYMVGRKLSDQFAKKENTLGDVLLEVEDLTAVNNIGKEVLSHVSFNLRKGEILGFAGLMGAGRTETAMAIMGVLNARVTGEIKMEGKPFNNKTVREAIDGGINIVTEDRKELGLVLDEDIKSNIILASLDKVSNLGVINQNEVIKHTNAYFNMLKIKASSMKQQVGRLSGGNQQKVVIAKALLTEPKVLILDEPTRGIDVGAKAEIYQIMEDLAKEGVSIIMISSELPEVLAMSDRVVVMANGKVTGILENKDLTQEIIMKYATEV